MGSTIVIRRRAKKGTAGTQKTTRYSSPRKPKVTKGPYQVGYYPRSGQVLVVRFFVKQLVGKYPRFKFLPRVKPETPWYIIDMAERVSPIARGTSRIGYTKKEAIAVARRYRDKYGEFAKFPY